MERPYLHHFEPNSPIVGLINSAPITEVAFFYDVPANFLDNLKAFGAPLSSDKVPGYHGIRYGLSTEEAQPYKKAFADENDTKSTGVLLIGWDSKEKHLEFRETELFKEQIPLLRVAKNANMVSIGRYFKGLANEFNLVPRCFQEWLNAFLR